MQDLVPVLSTVLPIIASSLLIIVISANLYFKIRRKFPVSVNCWFCNTWSKVPYDEKNSFNCPICSQYNGFAKDGGYNKVIPEQHDELMNKSRLVKSKKSTASNGLCTLCNNNQQLKVFQLANFVPLVEENYDVEIQHFQKQLEKAYMLCRKCDRVLKKTIHQQNAWIFGNKIKNMCSNGISRVAIRIRRENTIVQMCEGILSVVAVLAVILTTASSIKFITKNLSSYIPAAHLPIYKEAIAVLNTSKVIEFTFLKPYFTKGIKTNLYSMICLAGVLYHMVKLIWGKFVNPTKVNKFLCWLILSLVAFVRHSKHYQNYILIIEALPCIYLLATAFSKSEDNKSPPPDRSKMRKLVKNLEYTCTDFSDNSDFEASKNSSTTSSSFNKSQSSLDVPIFNTATNLNSSFMTAKSSEPDLNASLNNLHLGGLNFKPPRANSVASFGLRRPKPVLSPPKFQTENSWVAGGFWKDSDGVLLPVRRNLSRSSSESSGFGSQVNEFPPRGDCFSEFCKLPMTSCSSPPSVFSEPAFPRKTFYPNLQNSMFVCRGGTPGLIKFNDFQRFENWSDKVNAQTMRSFRDLRLTSSD